MFLDELLLLAREKGASDIHLQEGMIPALRVSGELFPIGDEEINTESLSRLLVVILDADGMDHFLRDGDADTGYLSTDGIRARISCYRSTGTTCMSIRVFPSVIPSMDSLRVPLSLQRLTSAAHGLVLVCGPTGSGKSTTLAAMIDAINKARRLRIITIEDPIEYIYTSQKAMVTQREVGKDCRDFLSGLRSALRQDPDVILVGELRDRESVSTALMAAETGHLVFTTLHAGNVIEAVDRIAQYFPVSYQSEVRNQLANALLGIAAQKLLPGKQGGRVAAFEILLPTPAITNLIRRGTIHEIRNYMHASEGMQTFDDAMKELRHFRFI